MFLFKKKNSDEEECRCELCEFAQILSQDRVYCEKKKKEKEAEESCSFFVLDLLKKRPTPAPVFRGFDPEDI